MNEIYIVQSWSFKKNNIHNDEVDIMGVFRHIENAATFLNDRFMYFMADHQRDFCNVIFPKIKRSEIINKATKHLFPEIIIKKILSYSLPDSKNAITVGTSIPNKEYNNQIIKINFSINNCYIKLMQLQQWISNHYQQAYFNEYCSIPIIINDELTGTVKRMSSETCRLTINDFCGNPLYHSFYLGHHMIDIENCEYRERHFCSTYRICSKTFRD